MTPLKTEIAEKLKSLAESISGDDRKEACEKYSKSHVTISNYLSGKVANEDFGLELLEFFHGRINDRAERLKAIA